MTPPLWSADDDLQADLTAALTGTMGEPDGGPPDRDEFVAAAHAAFAWRRVDEDLALAALVYDSAADEHLAGRIRSRGTARTLAFRGPQVTVEVEVTGEGMVGQLSPASGGQITGQSAAGEAFDEAEVDEVGCFVLTAPPPGPVRLHYRAGGHDLVTDWICVS